MKFCRVVVLVALITALWFIPGRCEWRNFTVADGLANNNVVAILADRNGDLWFGGGMLSRSDGVNWTTYTKEDGLAGNYVTAITEDNNGNLWFGTWEGVSQYDGTNWTTYTTADGLVSNVISDIVEDSNGTLWFATGYSGASHTGSGVSSYDGVNWRAFTTDDGLVDNDVLAVFEDSDGDMWFGTVNGASRYDGVSWTTYMFGDGLNECAVNAIVEDSNGVLWFGTCDGVSSYDGANWTTYDPGPDHSRYILAIVEDSRGDLWFGTLSHGVSRYDGVGWTLYTTEDGLAHNWVPSIAEDRFGALWFGTQGGGVSRYDGADWTVYQDRDGLCDNWVQAITEDRNGNMWFGGGHGCVSRFDGVNWTVLPTEDELANPNIWAIIEDSNGSLWFGTGDVWSGVGGGVSCYDGADWTTYSTTDGLAHSVVYAIAEDRSGSLWFGTWGGGVSSYDGVNWTTYTVADGLADNTIQAIAEDSKGDLWFGTLNGGVSCYDGATWTNFTMEDGLARDDVMAILEDKHGDLWFGTGGSGVSRYDGVNWTTYSTADGLASNIVSGIVEDDYGNIWVATWGGLSCYDGVTWTTYTTADGLAGIQIQAIAKDGHGYLWFGTSDGATRHRPDRVAPETMIWPRPPRLSASTIQTIRFCAAFGEVAGITFSYSMDGSAWSEWSSVNSWTASGLSDGEHVFRAMARDGVGNVDSIPAVCIFEIDATAPTPVITYPTFHKAIGGAAAVLGTAADLRFRDYTLEVRRSGDSSWQPLAYSQTPIIDGTLGIWDTVPLTDGDYDIRLSVKDTLGLTGIDLVQVVVDNEAPWAWETTPAVVSASAGGDVYTTNREIHLYFSPHAFDEATEVNIDLASLQDEPPEDVEALSSGYEISWKRENLKKPATLEMALGDSIAAGDSVEVLALYVLAGGQRWQRLGGTVSLDEHLISAPIDREGTYCLCKDTGGAGPGGGLSSISFAPRVFSPRGSFGNTEVGIFFALGRAGPVTVKVYNRAGYLVDEVAEGKYMNAGANVVRWDGRDSGGGEVPDGLYLVTVEAIGQTQVKTLAVVR